MKSAHKIYLIFLILLTFSVAVFGKSGEMAGIYSHTSEDANGDQRSWVFSLTFDGDIWNAHLVHASPDGMDQKTVPIMALSVKPEEDSLSFAVDGDSWTGQFVMTEEGKPSIVLIGDGKIMTFTR